MANEGWWIVGGVIAVAAGLVFVFRDQICQQMPEIPLLCKSLPFQENQPMPSAEAIQAVAPFVEQCKGKCTGYIVGSTGWNDCMKTCVGTATSMPGSESELGN